MLVVNEPNDGHVDMPDDAISRCLDSPSGMRLSSRVAMVVLLLFSSCSDHHLMIMVFADTVQARAREVALKVPHVLTGSMARNETSKILILTRCVSWTRSWMHGIRNIRSRLAKQAAKTQGLARRSDVRDQHVDTSPEGVDPMHEPVNPLVINWQRLIHVTVIALSVSVSATACQAQRVRPSLFNDYLSPELRGQVERLKREVRATASTRENGRRRAMVLWDWANAYAIAGGVLPVELPALIARVGGQRSTGPGSLRQIDRYFRELQLRDENPTALGTLTSDADDPFLPGSYVTIKQTYHFGGMEMVPGGGFLVAKHFMSNQGAYQATKPSFDNYITIQSSDGDARFVVDTRQMSGMHGGFRGATPGLFFRLEEGLLTERDTVTITYGDRSGGSRGFRVQTFSNDAFPLPLYVDLGGKGDLLSLPIQTYKVGGGPVHAVHAFAPSVVKTGEPFTASIRSEDFYYNRATGDIPAYEVTVNGRPFTEIEAGKNAITLLKDIRFDQAGVYRFRMRALDGKVVGQSNPVWVRDDPQLRIFWGDTHGHCGFAEGQGTPESFFEFGRDDARLDFLTHSEHDIWMDDSEWQTLKDNVDKYNQDGEFVAILGYEWTASTRRGGHHNVFFRNTENRRRVPNQTAPVLSQLYRRLANENDMKDVLIIPHAHMAGEYRMSDPHMETLVEIMSMHGNFEWFGRMYLQHGHEVGFVAASDDHLSHPGYASPLPGGLAQPGGLAAVLAPERTRGAIFDAMKDLAAYATTQQRIILDVTVNGARMGTRTAYRRERSVRGRVFGTAPITEVSILRNGKVISTEDLITDTDDESTSHTFEVDFYSESDPHVRDNPRGWRPWRGELIAKGATLKSISSPSITNRLSERVTRNGADPNRVTFSMLTRGSHKNLVIELEDIGDEATVDIDLAPVGERPSSPPLFRRSARLRGKRIEFALDDLERGELRWERTTSGFEEAVSFRRMKESKLDHEFEFTDADDPRQGDYYFVRVRQLDGGMAWSSPVWIGGTTTRYPIHDHPHD